ncbi:MAG: M28 family peptidase [Cyclobacteriaceae bacterium]|nr:M28 family peptidase [Cyclobacteriaceae bacterium]
MIRASLLILTILCFTVPVSSQNVKLDSKTKSAMERVDKEKIKSHIAYLADDKLKGRMPGKEGYQMAVDYVVKQFTEIGVAPGGDNGTYLQKLILRRATVNNAISKAVLVDRSGNVDSLKAGRDIFIVPGVLRTDVTAQAPLVFVGYGIEIPGSYSDYENIDVKGKIVVFLNGSPQGLNLPSTLMAHFNNAASKMEIAAQKGAIGAIVAPATPTAPISAASVTTAAMNPEKTEAYGRSVAGNLRTTARIPFSTLQRIFFNSTKSLTETLANLRNGKPGSFELPFTMLMKYTSAFNDIESYNVIGKITGSDNKLKDEYVVHTAHLDHVGIGRPIKGDSIYNGAHDNASGVASLLEISRIYKNATKPLRSVLIVMVTAEEMGLLGSAYFAGNPTVPKSQIVANVNTDMPTLIAPLLSVAPLGAEHSSLVKNVDFACQQLGIVRQEDPMPEEVRFIRSDQYSFVQQGIPALHVKYGTLTKDNSFDLVEFTKKWRDENYHRPSDEITNNFDFEAGRKYVQLNFLISYSVAQTKARPTWNAGDFFGQKTIK